MKNRKKKYKIKQIKMKIVKIKIICELYKKYIIYYFSQF